MTILNRMQEFVGSSTSHIFASVVAIDSGGTGIKCHTCVPNLRNNALPKPVNLLKCGGAGMTDEQSKISALGEGLERYAATRFSIAGEFRKAIMHELDGDVLTPDRFQGYTSAEYLNADLGLVPIREDSVIKWYKARNMSSGRECWVPGPLGVFAYRRAQDEAKHYPTTSTGLALGASAADAKMSALLEAIERDCVALAWTWRLPVQEVDPDDAELRAVALELGLPGTTSMRVFQIGRMAAVPVFLAMIRFYAEGHPYICIGSAARMQAAAALRKAVMEAAQGIPYVQFLRKRYLNEMSDRFSEVTSFERSAAYYNLYPHRLEQLISEYGDVFNVDSVAALDNASRQPQMEDIRGEAQLDGLLELMRASGHEVYFMDVTSPDLAQAEFTVVRAIVPSLYTLEGNHNLRVRNHTRAQYLVGALGCDYRYNRYPHPLP